MQSSTTNWTKRFRASSSDVEWYRRHFSISASDIGYSLSSTDQSVSSAITELGTLSERFQRSEKVAA
jgi:hypothetical protein